MKGYQFLIGLATSVVLIIAFGDVLKLGIGFLLMLVPLGHIILIFTVIAILKAPRKSKRTFEEYFYEDWDKKRN